jgi:hypothetical protein
VSGIFVCFCKGKLLEDRAGGVLLTCFWPHAVVHVVGTQKQHMEGK